MFSFCVCDSNPDSAIPSTFLAFTDYFKILFPSLDAKLSRDSKLCLLSANYWELCIELGSLMLPFMITSFLIGLGI